jgi:hypothetical protein
VNRGKKTMKKHITRVLSILAIVALAIVLPACESSGDYGYSTTYVGYGYGYAGYGGYYGAGCCYGGGYGAVVVRPPVGGYGGARVMHY